MSVVTLLMLHSVDMSPSAARVSACDVDLARPSVDLRAVHASDVASCSSSSETEASSTL